MSDADKHQEDPKGDLLDRLIDLDQISKKGATLKIVSDNMRALLACIAMFVAVVVLYNHQSNHWFYKASAVFWGIWTAIYAILASLQASFIMGFALFDSVVKIIHPDLFKQYKHQIVWFVVAINMVIIFGTLLLVAVSVLRTFGAK